jgi:putative SOS response-associated peptidase YedK
MCSRYFLDADGNVIAYTFQVAADDHLRKRFNIAPTQDAPIVRAAKDGGRELAMARWGLVPFWAKELSIGTRMINARCEGVETKPAFKAAIEKRRCIVPATGFFEWQGVAGRKQPFAITLPDRHVFGFAGLWERWKPPGGGDPVETFTIVTTDANEAVAPIHDRMPVILPQGSEEMWLHGDPAEACKLLTPYSGTMMLRAVSRFVSNVNNEGPECLDDAEPSWGSQQSLL